MKRFLCAILAVMMIGCVSVALAEQCKYGSADSPCDIIWYVDGDAQKHCRACRNHIEDKEDMSSYVQLTDWEDCTVDEETGECSVCGTDYVNEPNDENYAMYMLEFYMMKSAENGTAPVIVSISGNTMSVEFTEDYLTFLDEFGLAYPSEMRSATVYTITTTGGDSFAYTGEEVKPEVTIDSTGKGPGAWMENMGRLSFGDVTYANNVNAGTATASVEVSVSKGETYAFAATFTIGDGASDRLPGDATGDDSVTIEDAIAILQYASGENVGIDLYNADVTGDGKVDLFDALRILQYDAGWDVTLE